MEMIILKNQKIGKNDFSDKIKEIGKKEGKSEERTAILNKLADDEKIGYTREELTQILGITIEKPQETQNPPISIEEIEKRFNEKLPNVMKGKPLKYKENRKEITLLDELIDEGKEDGRIEEKIAIINKLVDDEKIEYTPEELSKKIWDDE